MKDCYIRKCNDCKEKNLPKAKTVIHDCQQSYANLHDPYTLSTLTDGSWESVRVRAEPTYSDIGRKIAKIDIGIGSRTSFSYLYRCHAVYSFSCLICSGMHLWQFACGVQHIKTILNCSSWNSNKVEKVFKPPTKFYINKQESPVYYSAKYSLWAHLTMATKCFLEHCG